MKYAPEVWPGAAEGRRLLARLQAIRAAMTSRLQFSPTWMPAMRPRLTFSFMSPLRNDGLTSQAGLSLWAPGGQGRREGEVSKSLGCDIGRRYRPGWGRLGGG